MPQHNAPSSGGAAEFTRFRSKNAYRTMITKVFVWIIAVLLLLAAVIVAAKLFFSIDVIVVDGTGHYSFTEITQACGIEKGQLMFGVSEKKLNSILTDQFAFVRSVKVKKDYPSTIYIEIEEETPEFYFEMNGEYFLVTRGLKVLDHFEHEEALTSRYPDVMQVLLPTVSRAVVTEQVAFAVASKSRHTDEVLTQLAESRLMEGVTSIDLSDRFDITLGYEDRIVIHMGSATDFADKLDLALGMIKAYSEEATGVLYAENIEQGIAQIDDPQQE